MGPRCGVVRRGRKGRAGRGARWREAGSGDPGAAAAAGSALGNQWARGPWRPSPVSIRSQAAAYGRCVQASTAPGGCLKKDLCAQEFEALRSCFAAAVSGRQLRPGVGPWGAGTHVTRSGSWLPFLLGSVLGSKRCFNGPQPHTSRRDPRRHGGCL